MKFTLTIEMGNAAMMTANDLGRAVADVGHQLVTRWDGCDFANSLTTVACGNVRDYNGNSVGTWEVSE